MHIVNATVVHTMTSDREDEDLWEQDIGSKDGVENTEFGRK